MTIIKSLALLGGLCAVVMGPPVIAEHVFRWTETQAIGAFMLWELALGMLALIVQAAHSLIRGE